MATATRTIGKRIADQRRLAGVTQAQLAEQLGIATETLSRIETGHAVPTLTRIEQIAIALNIELVELFRYRRRQGPETDALNKLLWVVSRRRIAEIELVTEIASRIFEHTRRRRRSS